jgi:hypothetical protein
LHSNNLYRYFSVSEVSDEEVKVSVFTIKGLDVEVKKDRVFRLREFGGERCCVIKVRLYSEVRDRVSISIVIGIIYNFPEVERRIGVKRG